MARKRLWAWLAGGLALGGIAIAALGYANATAAPVVRRLNLVAPGYPATTPPVSILLFSDAHVHAPDMPPSRLARIVDRMNALHPDIIVGTGDFTGNNWIGRDYPAAQAIAPLERLKAKFGVYAVLGNNDYRAGADEVARALEGAGIHLLRNDATAVGPIALGGIDGRIHHRLAGWTAARESTYAALDRTPGVQVLAAHRPDELVPAPQSVRLVVAGHTHCGQIVLPFLGALESGSDYGMRYLCGVHRDGWKLLVVTAGLGTSYLPLRYGAPPDMWLITVRGPASQGSKPSARRGSR